MNAPDGKVFWLIASDTGVLRVLETPSPCIVPQNPHTRLTLKAEAAFIITASSRLKDNRQNCTLSHCCQRKPVRLTIRVLDDCLGVPHEFGMLGLSVHVAAGGGSESAG